MDKNESKGKFGDIIPSITWDEHCMDFFLQEEMLWFRGNHYTLDLCMSRNVYLFCLFNITFVTGTPAKKLGWQKEKG